MHRARRIVLALMLAAIAILAACSSSGTNSSTSGTPEASSSGSGSGSGSGSNSAAPLAIGVICSCSGPAGATLSAIGDVAQAWGKWVNSSGGIQGRPVNLIFKDDASNPGTSVTAAQSLISSHVAAIIDISSFPAAWSQAVSAADIPVIGGLIASPQYYQDPDFYPSGQTDDSAGYADVRTAKAAGATNMGQFYCAEVPACKNLSTHQIAGKKLGVPLVYTTAISATAPNYTAQCLAAKQAGVTALFIGDAPQVVAHVAEDCTQQGYKPIYILQGGAYTNQLASTPGLKDNLWMSWSIEPYFANTPEVQQMNRAVDKYYPGLRNKADSWSGLSPQAWTAGLLIEKAVQAAGAAPSETITGTQVKQGLESLHGDNLDGWSPPLTFASGKPHPVNCWYTAHVQNGRADIVNSGKLTCEGPQ